MDKVAALTRWNQGATEKDEDFSPGDRSILKTIGEADKIDTH